MRAVSTQHVERFERDGFAFPMRCMMVDQARSWHERFAYYEQFLGLRERSGILRQKAHLAFTFMYDLVSNAAILDALEPLLGPDILCVTSVLWVKNPRDPRFVSWHQDVAYSGLDPHQSVLSWTAITDSTKENGCVRFIPGSQKLPLQRHDETHDPNNYLSRGQTLREVDASAAVDATLQAGEFSLHDERTIHGSEGNRSDHRRIGFTGVYVPTHVRPVPDRRSALLVRGEDRYGHWDLDPIPRYDLDPECLKVSEAAFARYVTTLPQAAQ